MPAAGGWRPLNANPRGAWPRPLEPGRTRVSLACSAASPRPLLPPAPGSAQPFVTSSEDRRCPQLSDELADQPSAGTSSTILPDIRGILGTHRAQGASGARAPAPKSPGHKRSHRRCSWRPADSAPSGWLNVHFRNPWFPSKSTFQVPHASPTPPHLSSDSPLTLGGLGGLRKVGLGQERQRDRVRTLSPRGCSKATPASNSTAPGLQPSARVRDLLRLYSCGVKSLWFILEFYVVVGVGVETFFPGCVIISLTF